MNSHVSALEAACTQAMIELYGNTDEYADLPMPEFSKSFERKIQRLSAHVRNNKYHVLTRTAKVILVAAIIALLTILSVTAARQFGFLLIDHNAFSELDMEKQSNAFSGDIICTYIPENFDLSEENRLQTRVTKKFQNISNEFFIVTKWSAFDKFGVDTETINPREIPYNGITYTVAGPANAPVLLWMDPETECLYEVTGNISEEELFQIAISTK